MNKKSKKRLVSLPPPSLSLSLSLSLSSTSRYRLPSFITVSSQRAPRLPSKWKVFSAVAAARTRVLGPHRYGWLITMRKSVARAERETEREERVEFPGTRRRRPSYRVTN